MENNQRNSRKRLNSLILLVAFTAVMLIVSTYAWFSAQKNVTLGGLKGKVSVAEGLEISLDAKYWSQEVNFGDTNKYATQNALKKVYAVGKTLEDGNLKPSDPEHNIIPEELLPVSTTGNTGDGIGQTDMKMYRGLIDDVKELYQIIQVQQKTDDEDGTRVYSSYPVVPGETEELGIEHHDYPGYYAIDVFLRNSTKDVSTSDQTGGASVFNKVNELQLNSNSKVQLQSLAANSTGLQNTVRVAFALYNMSETYDQLSDYSFAEGEDPNWENLLSKLTDEQGSAYMTASQEKILKAYEGQTINDVAIWEPNASDHVQYVVSNNNNVTWLDADKTTYGIPTATNPDAEPPTVANKFGLSTPIPTYALTSTATTLSAGDSKDADNTIEVGASKTLAAGIKDIYNWGEDRETGLAKQVTLQTEKQNETTYAIGKVKQLVSVTADNTKRYTIGTEDADDKFSIPKGKVCKVRMYVWLEGQDVDTINHASHGGGILVDVGLLKDGIAES